MTEAFAGVDLALLRDAPEVRIVTTARAGAAIHGTIIWVVVDSQDRLLIRSYLGPNARWYREALAHPECRLEVGDRVLDVRAVAAGDPERVASCSDELRTKYAGHGSMPIMLRRHLATTLELLPRS